MKKRTVDQIDTLEFLRRRERARQKALDRRFRQAWRDFDRIVAYIISEHQPRSVWQWGSLLDRKRFNESSDLDIAVQGLRSAHELFEIVARAERFSDFPVDIVELEKIEPEYGELIRRKGKLVYGSP
jgi:predicted nucleotidyltransferase